MAAQHPLPPESELSENNLVKPETDGESQTNVDALEHLPFAGDSDHPENGAAKSETGNQNQKSPDETGQLHAAVAAEHHIFTTISQVTTTVTQHAFLANRAAFVARAMKEGPEIVAATESESPGCAAQLEVEGEEPTKKKRSNKKNGGKNKNGPPNEFQETGKHVKQAIADSSVVEIVLKTCRAEKSQESTQTKHENGKPDIHSSSAHHDRTKNFKKKRPKTAASTESLGMVSIQHAKQVYIRYHLI